MKFFGNKFELIKGSPDEERIASVRAEFEAFLTGKTPSTAVETDFIRLYTDLFVACGSDEERTVLEFNLLGGVQPDYIPEYPDYLVVAEARDGQA